MVTRQTKPEEMDKVLAFYKSCNYGGGAKSEDLIIAVEKNKKFIAVVRLCNENEALVLRGMQVDIQFQGQGIGKALLSQLDKVIGMKTCYCIPYGHLEIFYSNIGFEKINEAEAPAHLFQRLLQYKRKDPNMIIMKRQYQV